MLDSTNRDAKIQEWLKSCEELKSVKAKEMELRKEIASYVLQDVRMEAFSSTLKLGNGYGLKATNVINYTLDSVDRIETIVDKLSSMNRSEVASDVFKWKPSLSESTYKKLDPEMKAIIDEVVCIKIGSPKLEFIEPKAK